MGKYTDSDMSGRDTPCPHCGTYSWCDCDDPERDERNIKIQIENEKLIKWMILGGIILLVLGLVLLSICNHYFPSHMR